MKYAVSAKVKYPNTPESDKLPEVMHVVRFNDGTEQDVMATDPMNAMHVADVRIQMGLNRDENRPK